ncbi:MAG: DUF935 domain-containing protein [Luteimonas sp.]|nr:DUF935 domain-containing protein [Luteimonas sp.]
MATKTSRIVDQRGNPIQYEVLEREISAGGLTGIRQVWHPSVTGNLTPPRLASILRAAAEGDARDYLTLAEEMEEKDLHYASVLSTRRLALAGLPVRVDSYSDDPADVKLADEIRELVAAPWFYDARFDLTDALGKGYSVCEIVWDRSSKPWRPVRLPHRDPRFFQYDRATGQELRLLDEEDAANGIEMAPYKFVVHRPRIRTGLPIRGGLARLAAVGYMCKAWSWKDWMAFADIFGMPMRVGTYGPNATAAEIRKLMSAVANLGSDAAAVLPDGTKITFEQAPNTSGAADFFEKLANWWDKQISKGMIGQTMTSDDGASLSQAQVHNDVRLDILDADARAESSTWNRDFVRPYVDLNYGHGRYPQLVVVVPQPEDTKALVEAIERLVPLGLEVEQSVIRDRLNLPEPASGKDVKLLRAPVQQPTPPAPPALNRAENREQPRDREDQLLELLASRADPVVGEWVEQIEALVQRAVSLEEIRDGLIELLPDMPADRFGQVMQRALAIAGVAGMGDAADESNG